MVDNFEMAESKYGRIFKVAGPRKYSFIHSHSEDFPENPIQFGSLFLLNLLLLSRRRREYVRLQNVRTSQGRLGQARW